jgi:hypothetical protein
MTMVPPRPQSPQSSPQGMFSVPFERFIRDEMSDWASAFTLLGVFHFIPSQRVLETERLTFSRYDGNILRFTNRSPSTNSNETWRSPKAEG